MNLILYRAVGVLFTVMELAILVRAFISWLPISRESRFVILLYKITEPVLAPIRNMIQRSAFGQSMMFDFSPVIALLLLALLRSIVLGLLF